jgi:hypothetical protein
LASFFHFKLKQKCNRNQSGIVLAYKVKMEIIKLLIAIVFALAGIVGSIIILIEAFKDEIWKGVLCLLCGLYFLYYALFDFEHDNKWPIVLLALLGNGIAAGIMAI